MSRKKNKEEIQPEEIFLDSSNLPDFDVHQFEGRIEKPISRRALIGLGVVFICLGVLYGARIWNLQIAEGKSFETLSENNILHNTPIFAERGVIYDRTGTLLAWNSPNPANPDFPLRTYAPIDGIAHTVGYVKYPQKDSSGAYYNQTYQGMDGVESFYNDQLGGTNGVKITETDAVGKVQSENTLQPPQAGAPVTLSINANYDQVIYDDIKSLAGKIGFTGGAAALMDLKTGEILAMTSYPEYSSEAMSNPNDYQADVKSYVSDPDNPFLNRFTDGLYAPGSTIKPFIAVAALNEKVIDPLKQILSTGSISIPNPYDPTKKTVFNDWRPQGWIDMRHAIAVSSDVYFYEVGGGYQDQPGLGVQNIEKYLRLFGFGTSVASSTPAASTFFSGPGGTIPDPAWKAVNFPDDPTWRIGDTYHTTIGQYGFQVTPMQLLLGVATIANDGVTPLPTLIKSSVADTPTVPSASDIAGTSNIIPETAQGTSGEATSTLSSPAGIPADNFTVVKEGMRLGVTQGIAIGLNMPDMGIAAKTGTAELGTQKKYVNSWVEGFFPYDNPHYAFVFLMEKGPETNTIGASYVAREFFQYLADTHQAL